MSTLSRIGRVAVLSAALSGVGMVTKAPAQEQPVTNPAVVPATQLPTAPADPGADAGSMARVPLSQVIDDVLRSHPEVAAAQARYEAALQRPPQERALPDPMISTGYASAGAPYPGAGLGEDPNASLGLMLSQEIPYPGKRELRAEVMRREAAAERQQVDAARLSLIARTKQAYFRLAAAYQLDEILRSNHDLLTTLLKVSESRYAVGQAAQQDVIRTQAQLSLIALQRERVARERRTREGELNALMNRAPEAPIGRPADLAPMSLDLTLPALVARAASGAPMLLRDRLMASRSEAAIAVAKRDFKPDFAVSGGYNYMGSMPDMFEFRFDVVVPLQRARRRAAVAERELTLAADQQTAESTRLLLQNRVQEDYQMATTAGELATLYRDAVLPQAQLALESSVSSYQTGAVDFLSVLTNFGSVLEYEMSYLEQLAEQHTAVSRLEEMAAVTLFP
jgi:cobalt-zinc-cadmium efflux system outer membrane protein